MLVPQLFNSTWKRIQLYPRRRCIRLSVASTCMVVYGSDAKRQSELESKAQFSQQISWFINDSHAKAWFFMSLVIGWLQADRYVPQFVQVCQQITHEHTEIHVGWTRSNRSWLAWHLKTDNIAKLKLAGVYCPSSRYIEVVKDWLAFTSKNFNQVRCSLVICISMHLICSQWQNIMI